MIITLLFDKPLSIQLLLRVLLEYLIATERLIWKLFLSMSKLFHLQPEYKRGPHDIFHLSENKDCTGGLAVIWGKGGTLLLAIDQPYYSSPALSLKH